MEFQTKQIVTSNGHYLVGWDKYGYFSITRVEIQPAAEVADDWGVGVVEHDGTDYRFKPAANRGGWDALEPAAARTVAQMIEEGP